MTGTPLARVAGGDEFFAAQPTPARALPDPTPLVENLTRCAIEVLAGARDLDQMSRWVIPRCLSAAVPLRHRGPRGLTRLLVGNRGRGPPAHRAYK